MFSFYDELCTEVYNLTKPTGHSLHGDIEFYRDRVSSCKGRILEAAVGSGRMLIPLLKSGVTVDGIDYSPQMLDSCRKRCRELKLNPNLYEGQLQDFSLEHRYEFIIMPTGSFLLLEQRKDSLDALRCFYRHLQSGGKLILDLELPDPSRFELNKTELKTFEFPQGYAITMEERLVEVDFLEQYTVSYLKYEKWQDGKLLQTELQRFALRWYGIEEFKLVLDSIGFSDVVVSTNYEYGEAPSKGNQLYTFEATRK